MKNRNSQNSIPENPGKFLEDILARLGMGKDELSRRMNRPAAKLSLIFNGTKAVTPETALQLEKVTGVGAHIWTHMEEEYRLALARQRELAEIRKLSSETRLISKFPYNELMKTGYAAAMKISGEKAVELQKFFGVTSLKNLPGIKRYRMFYQLAKKYKTRYSPESFNCWLRIGELKAGRIDCSPFNRRRLKQIISEIIKLSLQTPREAAKQLEKLLSDCGIALVTVPPLPKAQAWGAAFWLGKDKAVIIISDFRVPADILWPRVLQLIGHILLHSKMQIYVGSSAYRFIPEEYEAEAAGFADEQLLSEKVFRRFLLESTYSREEILEFSRNSCIHPAILAARLFKDKRIEESLLKQLRSV